MTDIKMGYMDKHNGEARTFVLRVREDGSIYIIGQKTIEGSVCACQLAHYAEGSLVFLGVEEDDRL
jgi:hypothetical protein